MRARFSRRFPLVSLLVVLGFGMGMTVEEIPNPQTIHQGFVTDAGGVLGPEYLTLIDGVCRELERKTTAELAVVTVDNLDGTTVEDYAERLFRRLAIGKRDRDNGILILFARDDRRIKFEVGYGLEGVLTDAQTGMLLDTYAVPWFKNGEYGRGLYGVTKAAAEAIAATIPDLTLEITDPATWPVQVVPPKEPLTSRIEKKARQASPLGYYFLSVLGMFGLGLGLLGLRVWLPKAKAAKGEALGRGYVFPTLIWGFGGIAVIIVGGLIEQFFLPAAAYLGTSLLATFSHLRVRRGLRNFIDSYRRACPKCGEKMDLVSEGADDRYLTEEEIAEERAGGMDYEFWRCEKCDLKERLEVKLGEADKCPKCRRRTLHCERTVLEAATTSHGGKERYDYDCKNPKCDYRRHEIRRIPQKSSSSGSGGGGSSSGGGSFGGGRSGGGGASRGW